jgi:hypothetical protein
VLHAEKDVSATMPGCSICEKGLARVLRSAAQKDANGMRRVDVATVPGQTARLNYERTTLAR